MINEQTDLMKAIGVGEDRTVEETGGGDSGQVQHVIADGHARSSRWSRFGLEHSEREVLYGEVRARVDFDKGSESHDGDDVVRELRASRKNEAANEREWEEEEARVRVRRWIYKGQRNVMGLVTFFSLFWEFVGDKKVILEMVMLIWYGSWTLVIIGPLVYEEWGR